MPRKFSKSPVLEAVPAKAAGVCLQVKTMTPEEAEFGVAEDHPRAALQRQGSHGIHSGRGHSLQEHVDRAGPRGRVRDLPVCAITWCEERWTVWAWKAASSRAARTGQEVVSEERHYGSYYRQPEDAEAGSPVSLSLGQQVHELLDARRKKSVAQKVFYDALEIVRTKVTDAEPIDVFHRAVENVKPDIEVRSLARVRGASYQVPMQVNRNRQQSLAIRWLLLACREKKGRRCRRSWPTSSWRPTPP